MGDRAVKDYPGKRRKRAMKEMDFISKAYGHVIIKIDDEDYWTYKSRKWTMTKIGHNYYFHGAITTRQSDKRVYLHRLLMGNPKGFEIDHIDGDGLNLQKSNLRIATRKQNGRNTKRQINNTSGFKGVSKSSGCNTFHAYIKHNGKRKTIGYFKTPIQAAVAYNEKAKEYFGEFARLNPILK